MLTKFNSLTLYWAPSLTTLQRSGEEIPLEQVPGLLVTVHAGKSSYPDDSLDVFMPSTYSPLWDATQYKVCGAAPA